MSEDQGRGRAGAGHETDPAWLRQDFDEAGQRNGEASAGSDDGWLRHDTNRHDPARHETSPHDGVPGGDQSAAAELVASGLAEWREDSARRPVLIVRGQANLLDETAAADLERVRRLLDELEDRQEIVRLLEGARDGQGCRIFIGSENRMFALSGSSVIAAPYRGSQGEVVGVVGVIGPTRLNYARVVPMVDFTAQALTRLMG